MCLFICLVFWYDIITCYQTWPTEAEIAKADEDQKQKKIRKRKLPAGTSEYQAAWIINESDEEVSDSDNEDGMVLDEGDGFPGQEGNKYLDLDGDGASLGFEDSEDETDNDSVMMVSLLIPLQY
jgi:pre-rRNA-processing protein TSR1